MRVGKKNLIAGFLFMFISALGGLFLGATFDSTYASRGGDHIVTMVRFYLREGHSHGMPISMLNVIVGLVIDRMTLSERSKEIASWATICGIILPIGLAAKGAAGAPAEFPPFGMLGVLGLFISISLCLYGAVKLKVTKPKEIQ